MCNCTVQPARAAWTSYRRWTPWKWGYAHQWKSVLIQLSWRDAEGHVPSWWEAILYEEASLGQGRVTQAHGEAVTEIPRRDIKDRQEEIRAGDHAKVTMMQPVADEQGTLVEEPLEDILCTLHNDNQRGNGSVLYEVEEQVMLVQLRKDFFGETLDAHIP